MIILDANIILRYLLNDNEEMAEKAEQYVNAGDAAVTTEVIAEVVYVLQGVYSLGRDEISETITAFLELVSCRDHEVLKLALSVFGKENLDFVDCVLYSYNIVSNIDIATFDKKLLRLISTK